MRAFLLCAAACISLPACIGNMDWRTVTAAPAPSRFAFAPDGTVWGYGRAVMHRDAGKVWRNVDVCGPYAKSAYYSGNKQELDLAFAGGVTWVLCGNTTLEGQELLRYEGGNAVLVPLPNDTDVQLIQLDSDVALVGPQALYQHVGAGFTAVPGSAPPRELGLSAAGRSLSDIYLGGFPQIVRWDGTSWTPLPVPPDNGSPFRPSGVPVWRSGHVYAGGFELIAGVPTAVVRNNPGLARPLAAFAVLGPDEAIFIGVPGLGPYQSTTNAYFWRGKEGDADFHFLGDAPFVSGSLYSAGGQSGWAIDEHTLLVLNSNGQSSAAELDEGQE